MSRVDIAIVDYQMGNLRSVQKALERVGSQATITNDPNQIAEARKVILPGVGAFGDAMRELRARGLPEPIVDSIRSGKPFLGICLGLQLLFERATKETPIKVLECWKVMWSSLSGMRISKFRTWDGIASMKKRDPANYCAM